MCPKEYLQCNIHYTPIPFIELQHSLFDMTQSTARSQFFVRGRGVFSIWIGFNYVICLEMTQCEGRTGT